MQKILLYSLLLICSLEGILLLSLFSTAEEPEKIASDLPVQQAGILLGRMNVSFGKEFLIYSERESDTQSDSYAIAKNQILRFEAFVDSSHNVFGIKGVIPATVHEVSEEWDSLGYDNYQKNALKYQWTRYDGYYGYSFYHPPQDLFYTVYGGARWSKTKFKRNDFVVLGTLQNVPPSTESVKSLGLLLGLKGEGVIKEQLGDYEYRDKKDEPPAKWVWGWGMETVIPFKAELTNTTIPGVTLKNRSGYTFELNAWLAYQLLPEAVSIDAVTYLGNMAWKGSDWKNTPYGQTKWPRNSTTYLLVTLSLNWRF